MWPVTEFEQRPSVLVQPENQGNEHSEPGVAGRFWVERRGYSPSGSGARMRSTAPEFWSTGTESGLVDGLPMAALVASRIHSSLLGE